MQPIFSDNMVLQRNAPVPIYGEAETGTVVTVQFNGQVLNVTADAEFRWRVDLAPMAAGGPFELVVTCDENALTFHNVMVGEVWIAVGASNMARGPAGLREDLDLLRNNDFPAIRFFDLRGGSSLIAGTQYRGAWTVADRRAVRRMSGIAFWFAYDLHVATGVPVGVVVAVAGGGSDHWAARLELTLDPKLETYLARGDGRYESALAQKQAYEAALAAWRTAYLQAKSDGSRLPRKPREPRFGGGGATSHFYGKIAPLIPYRVGGVIWYIGIYDIGDSERMRLLVPAIARGWRREWGQDITFCMTEMVRLGGFTSNPASDGPRNLARNREAHAAVLQEPLSAVLSTVDISSGGVHFNNRHAVGSRAALAARALHFGEAIEYLGPIFDGMTVAGNEATLSFTHLGGGLTLSDSGPPRGFAVAGADGVFRPAEARIEGDTVVVSSPEVAVPVHVRYAFVDGPNVNLFSAAGLPMVGFRTDNFGVKGLSYYP
ncbi:MAG: hypothetical protein M5U26_23610 [Planctomycetota bacterium]|nr:hypothetical protein [Planctomycetota bacterium]